MSVSLVPSLDLWEWQDRGLCRQSNPEVFFHPDGERGPARRWREERALAVCRRCPVLQQCRDHALQVDEPYGIWGGMTEQEGSALRTRGAPPSGGEDLHPT